MDKIYVDTEKLLRMIVQNADRHQNSIGGDDGQIVIGQDGHIEYAYPSPGTYYQNAHMVDPEDFFNIEDIEKNYNLDITGFQTDARDIVLDEVGKGKDYDGDLTDSEYDKISEYVNQWIDEWKEWARIGKNNILKIEDSEGTMISEYRIVWDNKGGK
jgi:hypothetical protein